MPRMCSSVVMPMKPPVTDQPLPVNLDGEIATTTPTEFTIQRNAVHVVVPQSSSSSLFDGPGAGAPPEGVVS